MDPSIFMMYAPRVIGLPLESKLTKYMNHGTPSTSQDSSPAANMPVPQSIRHSNPANSITNFTKQFNNLTLDAARSGSPCHLTGINWHPSTKFTVTNSIIIPTTTYNNPYPAQENVGGTTYFYPSPNANPSTSAADPAYALLESSLEENNPCNELIISNAEAQGMSYDMYSPVPSYKILTKPNPADAKNNEPSVPTFFIDECLKIDLLNKNALVSEPCNRLAYPDLPETVGDYQELIPLELPKTEASLCGYQTSMYKVTNTKNGIKYCLRRIHRFTIPNEKCLILVDLWKKTSHPNIIQLKDVFTTKAFNDDSTVFIYDYYPGAETLLTKYFSFDDKKGYKDPFAGDPNTPRPYSHAKTQILKLQSLIQPISEDTIWNYIIQLLSALRVAHRAGVAFRNIDPTKIVFTSRSRLRFSGAGVPDVVNFDDNTMSNLPQYQQEDLVSLGKVALSLACRSMLAIHKDNIHSAMDLLNCIYSSELSVFIRHLITKPCKTIEGLIPMIGARFFDQIYTDQLNHDVLENELSKELENGRLFRIMCKLATINERSELAMDPQWAETGDRYMLKLFRDYVFHQVEPDGRPWLDLAHIVTCLNKLDYGSPDKICLMSRDEQSLLIVSYAELKQCLESSFAQLAQAAKGDNPVE